MFIVGIVLKKINIFHDKGLTKSTLCGIIKPQRKEIATMMMTAKNYIEKNLGIEIPKGNTLSSVWFIAHRLPMIVRCTDCGTTMALMSARIDEDGECFCSQCAE